MQNKPLIKICGVRTAKLAEQAIRAGANLIGVVCHPHSRRYVDITQARLIAEATHAQGGRAVAVFVNADARMMRDFCEKTAINLVQLHGAMSRQAHLHLPAYYQRIYACSIGEMGLSTEDQTALAHCDTARDYVLFDHPESGCGQVFPWDALQYTGPLRIGIAGGLNCNNVLTVMQQFSPDLIDVSSGVEDDNGEKILSLINKFIQCVRG